MVPTLQDGDFVIVKTPTSNQIFSKNDIVILKKPWDPMLIKRVIGQAKDATYQLAGDGINSIPKIDLSNIHKNQIIGKAIFTINKLGIKKL